MFALAISLLYFVSHFFNGADIGQVVSNSATLLFWLLLLDMLIAVTVQTLIVVSGIGTYKMLKKTVDELDGDLFDGDEKFSFKKLFRKWKWMLPYFAFAEIQLILLGVLSLIGATVLKQAYTTGWDVSRLVIGGLMVYVGVFGRGQINTQRIKQDKEK